jgi:hypothetical protein
VGTVGYACAVIEIVFVAAHPVLVASFTEIV